MTEDFVLKWKGRYLYGIDVNTNQPVFTKNIEEAVRFANDYDAENFVPPRTFPAYQKVKARQPLRPFCIFIEPSKEFVVKKK